MEDTRVTTVPPNAVTSLLANNGAFHAADMADPPEISSIRTTSLASPITARPVAPEGLLQQPPSPSQKLAMLSSDVTLPQTELTVGLTVAATHAKSASTSSEEADLPDKTLRSAQPTLKAKNWWTEVRA